MANAGDSRCVLSRNGKAIELSFDHKPEDEPERTRIEKAGGKVTADGRVNGGLNLSRAIGEFYLITPSTSNRCCGDDIVLELKSKGSRWPVDCVRLNHQNY